MKKRQLLEMQKLTVTKQMEKLVQQDKAKKKQSLYGKASYTTYSNYQYYAAAIENGVLKVAIFMRKHIASGIKAPQFEIYIDKAEEKWLTYCPAEDKWYLAKIDMLNYDYDNGYLYGNKPYVMQKIKGIINGYLGTGNKEAKEAILCYQQGIRKQTLIRKHKNELEAIDSIMNVVPPLPKDFEKWVLKDGFIDRRYIFYKANRKAVEEGYCTNCAKMVPLKIRAYHNAEGKCTVCHSKIIYKAWNKQKVIVDDKNMGIMQKLEDDSGYILRKFYCKLRYERENEWKLSFGGAWEEKRQKLNDNLEEVDFFEWGEYKNTGVIRWCHELNHGGYWQYGESGFGSAVFYPKNMKRNLRYTKLQYMPVEDLLNTNKGERIYMGQMISELGRNQQYEFLIKAGLTKFTFAMVKGYTRETQLIDSCKKRPWEYLKMSREQFKECCNTNANKEEIVVIQIANKAKVKLEQKQVQWIAKYLGRSHLIKDMAYTTPHKMIRYLREILCVEKKVERVHDYIDYLGDCSKLALKFDEQTMYPKNFDKAHEEMSLRIQEKENEEKAKQKEMQDIMYQKSMKQKEKFFKYENNQFTLIMPRCKDDFQNEGREQHNCVGSYFERVINGDCVILFLRRNEKLEKAFCTVEIRGTKLIQCRTAYNKDAPEEAKRFVDKFLRELDKRISKDIKEKKNKKQMQVGVAV